MQQILENGASFGEQREKINENDAELYGAMHTHANAEALNKFGESGGQPTFGGNPIGGVPKGAIIMWSGAIPAIPTGWELCNGSNGTPDLRNRFIVGAGSTYAVGNTGGADSVALTETQMPKHRHNIRSGSAGTGSVTTFVPASYTTAAQSTTERSGALVIDAGSNATHENRPPYYALAYIMKL